MISLRELKEKDAALMLEWMHDEDVQKGFKKNMLAITLEQAAQFCRSARIPDPIISGCDLHYAIVDASDEYLGTISLKEVDLYNKTAEYAITTRKKAWGKGIATEATRLILEKAFEQYELQRVFLSVLADNTAAIKLYEKNGFVLEGVFRGHFTGEHGRVDWKWYGILKDEYERMKKSWEENR